MERNLPRSKKRMAITFTIGLATIVLVVWGLWAAIAGFIGLFRDGDLYVEGVSTESIPAAIVLQDRLSSVEPESAEYFEAVLERFVMQDVPPFASVGELPSEYVISFGLWQCISLNNSRGVLNPSDEGYRVPRELVEKLANYYVGYEEKFEHRTMDLCGTFVYNDWNDTYSIPVSYPTDYLVPDVVDVKLDSGTGTAEVTVDCYRYNEIDEDPTANEHNFAKREVYVLKKVVSETSADHEIEATHYQIVSMKRVERTSETTEETEDKE